MVGVVKKDSPLIVKKDDPFRPLYKSKKRYFFLTGGRGSLKSSSVHKFIAQLTYQEGHGILFTRYTMTSAEKSIIPEFVATLDRYELTSDFHITKTAAINKRTKSFIFFSGIKTSRGDQTGNLKSISGITTWIIEEGEDFHDEKAFDIIDDSIRTTTGQNRVIWIQNPTTKEHFIYKRWIKPASKKIKVHGYDVTVSNLPEVEHIHTTYRRAESFGYLETSWLSKKDKIKAEAEKAVRAAKQADKHKVKHSSKYYYTYIGGWLERAEGCIYTNWIEGAFQYTLYTGCGLDYGFSPHPLGLIEIALNKKLKKIYMRQLIYAPELSDEQLVEALGRVVRYKSKTLIVADTNEPRTTRKIKAAGFNIIKAQKEPGSIAAGIRELQDWQFVVDPESEDLKTELNNYVWNDKKADLPVDDFNHLLDALRYIFRKLQQKKKRGPSRRNR